MFGAAGALLSVRRTKNVYSGIIPVYNIYFKGAIGMKKRFTKTVAALLCMAMLLSVFPLNAFAFTYGDYTSETHTVFRHTEQTLAPGIEQYTNYAYLNDGEQVVYYVTISDLSRDDVVAQVAYKDMQCDEYGLDKLSNMVAVANQK